MSALAELCVCAGSLLRYPATSVPAPALPCLLMASQGAAVVFGQLRASSSSCWGVFVPVEKGELCLEIQPEAMASCCRPSPFGHMLLLVIFLQALLPAWQREEPVQ